MEIDVGQIVDEKYELRRLLGLGGMGQVWAARHRSLAHDVALKLLRVPTDGHEDERTARRRFQLEAQVAASLARRSRNIVQVTDHGHDRGMVYLVMELLDGWTLEACLDRMGRLDPPTTSAVVAQLARGLAVAHAEGVIHRDLKPGNVFLTHDDEGRLLVKVLDFGIAGFGDTRGVVPRVSSRLTAKGLVLGSPSYMSPEQSLAQPLDARADVWSLAVVAYEMLAGVPPFAGPTQEDTIVRVIHHRATPLREHVPELGDTFEAFFARAFAQRIDDRFATVDALARAFAAIAPPAERPSVLAPGAPAATAERRARAEEVAPDEGASPPVVPLRRGGLGVARAVAGAAAAIALVTFGVHAVLRESAVAPAASPAPETSHAALLPVPPPSTTATAPAGGTASASGVSAAVSMAPTATVRPAEAPTATAPSAGTAARHGVPPATAPPPPRPAPSASAGPAPAPSKTVDRSAVF